MALSFKELEKIEPVETLEHVQGDIIPPDARGAERLPTSITSDIEAWISEYCDKYSINPSQIDPRQWKAVCMYIGEHIKTLGFIHDVQREKSEGGVRYDPETVAALLPIFEYICASYKQTAFSYLFPRFAGVGRNYFNDYDGILTSSQVQLAQKAREVQRESIINTVSAGGSATVGNIFLAKALEGMSETVTVQHISAQKTDTASASLPMFNGDQPKLTQNGT